MKHKKTEAERWFLQAKRQLEYLDYFMDNKAYDFVCFHCQQGVEMGLKAILTLKEGTSPKSHSVKRMSEMAMNYFPELKTILLPLSDLDIYYTGARYPNGVPSGIPLDHLTEEDAAGAISSAREFISEISQYFI